MDRKTQQSNLIDTCFDLLEKARPDFAKRFDGAWVLADLNFDDKRVIFQDAKPGDTAREDIRLLMPDVGGMNTNLGRLRRIKNPKQIRGKYSRLYPTMYSLEMMAWNRERGGSAYIETFYGFGADKWHDASHRQDGHFGYGMAFPWDPDNCSLFLGHAFYEETTWSVTVARPGLLGLTFATDIPGIRQLLKDRDLPPGRSRRSAIRHWVNEHWRSKATAMTEDDDVFVREHMRGQIKCDWHGYNVTVNVSDMDQRRIARIYGNT